MKLSARSLQLLDAIRANPRGSVREWMPAIGVKATSTVTYHLGKLERAGRIKLHPGKARSVELIPEEASHG